MLQFISRVNCFPVCCWRCRSLQGTRPLLRCPPARHFCKRRNSSGVPHRRAHEVQERLQVQDRV